MDLVGLLTRAWENYSQITPDAPLVHRLLEDRGEKIVNDHVAFRTFRYKGVDRATLGGLFERFGYVSRDSMDFPEKRLRATYWLHSNPAMPKIFISELLPEWFPDDLQAWIADLARKAAPRIARHGIEALFEPSWEPVGYEDYRRFYPISEYAAWTAAFGIRVNHFTVLFNALRTFKSLAELNAFLVEKGIQLNESGGAIKGSAAEYLEQSSTRAREIPWKFAGGVTENVPSCYYEFAKRYALPGGQGLFQGFVPGSANRLFESTKKS